MIPADEDPMPLEGNPHPMPGVNPPQPFWAMPPYPTLGWNAVPPDHNPVNHGQNAGGWGAHENNDAGWGPWDEQVQQPPQQQVDAPEQQQDEVQEQNSMVLNPTLDSFNDMDLEEVQQPINPLVAQHPGANLDPIQLGILQVVYGPVLPPHLIWERSF